MFIWMSAKAQYSVFICPAGCICTVSIFPANLRKKSSFIASEWEESLGILKPPNLALFKYHHSFLASPIVFFASALFSPLPRLYAGGETQAPRCCATAEKTEIMYPWPKLWGLFSSSILSFRQKGFQIVECSFSCQQNHVSLTYLAFRGFLFSI